MTFQKGVAANPYGGNAKTNALARRMQGLTFKAADVIEKILNDDEATNGERLAAAKEVFDRAIGKPKQQATVEVNHNASPHLTALVGLAASVALRGMDVPQNDSQVIDITANASYLEHKPSEHADADALEIDADPAMVGGESH